METRVKDNVYRIELKGNVGRIKMNGKFCLDEEVATSLNISMEEFNEFIRKYGRGSATNPVEFADLTRAKLSLICLCGYAQSCPAAK